MSVLGLLLGLLLDEAEQPAKDKPVSNIIDKVTIFFIHNSSCCIRLLRFHIHCIKLIIKIKVLFCPPRQRH